MLDFFSIIFGRRSIRSYQDKPITSEQIKQILQAGMAAPSAVGKDPWRFIVVQEKDQLKAISQHLPNGKMLSNAGCGIVVCGDLKAAHNELLGYLVQDCSAAIQNMLLAVHSLGLGACWLGVYPREDRMENIKKVCAIPDEILPLSVLSIGHPAETKKARTRYNEAYIHQEKWNS